MARRRVESHVLLLLCLVGIRTDPRRVLLVVLVLGLARKITLCSHWVASLVRIIRLRVVARAAVGADLP